jgi:hypothetical protein
VHGHGVLMQAAVGVIGTYVPIVIGVAALKRRWDPGSPERRWPFTLASVAGHAVQ